MPSFDPSDALAEDQTSSPEELQAVIAELEALDLQLTPDPEDYVPSPWPSTVLVALNNERRAALCSWLMAQSPSASVENPDPKEVENILDLAESSTRSVLQQADSEELIGRVKKSGARMWWLRASGFRWLMDNRPALALRAARSAIDEAQAAQAEGAEPTGSSSGEPVEEHESDTIETLTEAEAEADAVPTPDLGLDMPALLRRAADEYELYRALLDSKNAQIESLHAGTAELATSNELLEKERAESEEGRLAAEAALRRIQEILSAQVSFEATHDPDTAA